MIIPVYKPLGASTHQLAAAVGARCGEKATHTGTLDPMAEGVVVVLTGADRFAKQQCAEWQKTYRFEMLFGVTTDSLDLLGLPNVLQPPQITTEHLRSELQRVMPQFIGELQQTLPDFSAKRISGESFFDRARRGEKLPPSSEQIQIYTLELLEVRQAELFELQETIKNNIASVTGDFRQAQIFQAWEATFQELQSSGESKLFIASLEARTSKRAYIRALVRDLAASLALPATTFTIIRTQNGPYTTAECEDARNFALESA